jgi:hypothetical protein
MQEAEQKEAAQLNGGRRGWPAASRSPSLQSLFYDADLMFTWFGLDFLLHICCMQQNIVIWSVIYRGG